MNRDILLINSLYQYYIKGKYSLYNINLKVKYGEIVGLIGLSGSGKTTLLRCIKGLIDYEKGEIILNIKNNHGNSIKRYSQLDNPRIGMIFQKSNLIYNKSVKWNTLIGRISMCSKLNSYSGFFIKKDKMVALECIKQVGLNGYGNRLLRTLSGGQIQRVGIARTLAQEPILLLGDEITANLDFVTAKKVIELIRKISQKKTLTVILAIHNIDLARQFCNSIIGLKNGEIIYNGSPKNLSDKIVYSIFS